MYDEMEFLLKKKNKLKHCYLKMENFLKRLTMPSVHTLIAAILLNVHGKRTWTQNEPHPFFFVQTLFHSTEYEYHEMHTQLLNY